MLWSSVTGREVGLLKDNLGSLRKWREEQLSNPTLVSKPKLPLRPHLQLEYVLSQA